MTDDLIARLREQGRWYVDNAYNLPLRAADRIETLEAENERLREALRPFAFLEMEKDEGLADTQYAWETIYSDRVQDWFSYEEIETARAALKEIEGD